MSGTTKATNTLFKKKKPFQIDLKKRSFGPKNFIFQIVGIRTLFRSYVYDMERESNTINANCERKKVEEI